MINKKTNNSVRWRSKSFECMALASVVNGIEELMIWSKFIKLSNRSKLELPLENVFLSFLELNLMELEWNKPLLVLFLLWCNRSKLCDSSKLELPLENFFLKLFRIKPHRAWMEQTSTCLGLVCFCPGAIDQAIYGCCHHTG